MERLILDTGVLIALARQRLDPSQIADDADAVLPAIAIAEYLAGVAGDENPARAASQRALLDQILNIVAIEEYDVGVAEEHAELLRHTRREGRPRGPHDLIVAATAKASDRILVTTDARARFEDLPGVRARVLTTSR